MIDILHRVGIQASPAEAYDALTTREGLSWAVFLMSLKSLLETGKGAPDPNDVKIDNWN